MRKIRKLFGVTLIIMALLVMQLPMPEADAATKASAFSINGTTLTAYKGKAAVVTIPDTVETIATDAFKNNTSIQEVRFGKNVSKIEPYAFWGCSSLDTVVLNDGLKRIDDFAFANCKAIMQFTVPDSVTSIGIYSFQDDVNMTDITIPYQCMDIHESSFDGCYKLVIHAPEGSYPYNYAQSFYIRQQTFPEYQDVENLPDTVKVDTDGDGIPDKVVPIGSTDSDSDGTNGSTGNDGTGNDGNGNANGGDSGNGNSGNGTWGLSTVSGNDEDPGKEIGSVRVVGYGAVVFMDNTSTTVYSDAQPYVGNTIGTGSGDNASGSGSYGDNLPKYAYVDNRIVADQAFYNSQDLGSVTLPDTITEIGQFSFARSSITDIAIPDGVTTISYGAFYHCDNLNAVTLPDSVMSVESKAFAYTSWVQNFLNRSDSTTGDYLISGGVLVAYRGNSSQVEIPEGVRVIAAEAFSGHEEIQSVSFPSSIRQIGEEAFYGCTSLNQMVFREAASVSSLSAGSVDGVISGSAAMEILTTSEKGLTKICDRAFADTALSSVALPGTVEQLGLNVFGSDTTIQFNGQTPTTTYEVSAQRLSNYTYRGLDANGDTDKGVVLVTGDNGVKAILDGADRTFSLSAYQIDEDQQLNAAINRVVSFLTAAEINGAKTVYSLTLTDESGIPITKLGKQGLTIAIPSSRMRTLSLTGSVSSDGNGLSTNGALVDSTTGFENMVWGVLTVDRNGQLERLDTKNMNISGEEYIVFTTYHLSPFAFYNTGVAAVEGILTDSAQITSMAGPDSGISYDGDMNGMFSSVQSGTFISWMRSFGYKVLIAGAMMITGFVLIIWKKKI